ncbi:hypothetical protein ACN08X_05925 [Rothia sp. P6271]|uniref:hypothetical protein n=1 Tax=unclassified Rothia (in: high G+C Gram-positive bacteria) TaxID=2689056 RepID=UPI003AC8DA9D
MLDLEDESALGEQKLQAILGETLERLESSWEVEKMGGGQRPTPYSLHTAIDQANSIDITPDEVMIRQCLRLIGGRRWGYARVERDKLRLYLESHDADTTIVDVLQVLSDVVEGQADRAALALNKLLPDDNQGTDIPDLYLLYSMVNLVSDKVKKWEPQMQEYSSGSWYRSHIARLLASVHFEKHDKNNILTEIGQVADNIIREPGVKRFVAIWLRSLQGHCLVHSGEYEWATRVLEYALDRAEKIMPWNEPLAQHIRENLNTARLGKEHISYR